MENDYSSLVEEFGSTSSRSAFVRLRKRRGQTPDSQQAVIVGIDASAKTRLEQQSDVVGKWLYRTESSIGSRK
ncbi:hypothetical protein RB195_021865 [Necator americanus]|uniref:Uncharacterized protein n=1 Tax=Necator americanus TaxID=51031 RepID=A0ABR1EDL7_NECAM